MALINISKLTFAYDGSYDYIFKNVSFQIDTDWKLGFCGRNGCGKTTFLKLLTGKYEYGGTITASVNFDYFPLEVTDKQEYTLCVLEKVAPKVELWQIQKELSQLALSEDILYRPFSTLSSGEQTKVLLAGLFLRENNFLLIDEPTNHLDMASRRIVARYLNGKAGFILVSHDRAFLDECVDHVLSINKCNIEIISGNYSVWAEQKARQDAFELAENKKLKGEISRLNRAAKRKSDWSHEAEREKIGQGSVDRGFIGHKAAKVMKTAKAIEKRQANAIEEKSKLLKNIEEVQDLKIHHLKHHANRLIELSEVAVFYGGREVLQNFNLTLEQGERIALEGGNGTGKSSILKLICGVDISNTGRVNIAGGLKISYVPQDPSTLAGSLSEYAARQKIDETLFKSILRKLDFSRIQFQKDMQMFSAGQKKKVLIARSLCEQAHVYVWDEPLNYIDILSRGQIESLILTHKPTMIFVEHDKTFYSAVATQSVKLD